MSCKPGFMRHKLLLQKENITADASGQEVPSWTLVDSVFGEVLGTTGGERIRGQQVAADISSVVTIWHRTEVSPQMRFVHGSRNLHIVSARDTDGRGEVLVCQCREDAG